MTTAFEAATVVERRSGDAGGPWQFGGSVAPGWDIGGVANGGYVLSIAARAMAAAAGRPPLSITAHYLSPGRPGPVEVAVEAVRIGGRITTLSASLRQDEREVIRVLGSFGAFPGPPQPLLTLDPPADVPPFDDQRLPRRRQPTGAAPPVVELPGLTERLDVRLRPGDETFATGTGSGRAEVAGWFAFADQQPGDRLDAVAVITAADAFYPPIFNTGLAPANWVPTLELTVHLRADAAPGPLLAHFRTDVAAGGLLGEDGNLWDSTGQLVAQSRQLALMPR